MGNKIFLFFIACLLMRCARTSDGNEPVNVQASIPENFNFTKRGFKVLNTMINKKAGTMSTLYGNDISIRAIKDGTQEHAPGLVMALVTWKERPSPDWYGDNIPGVLLSFELLTADSKTKNLNYSLFEGKRLVYNPYIKQAEQRKRFILAQKPSILP